MPKVSRDRGGNNLVVKNLWQELSGNVLHVLKQLAIYFSDGLGRLGRGMSETSAIEKLMFSYAVV